MSFYICIYHGIPLEKLQNTYLMFCPNCTKEVQQIKDRDDFKNVKTENNP